MSEIADDYIRNRNLKFDDDEYTNIEQFYAIVDTSLPSHSLTIMRGLTTKQLDEKFIPSSIARSSQLKNIIIHNSTLDLPEVVEGAILIAYDE